MGYYCLNCGFEIVYNSNFYCEHCKDKFYKEFNETKTGDTCDSEGAVNKS